MTGAWPPARVTVVGLGIEGEDLARYFASHGARVTLSDRREASALAARVQALAGLDIDFHLGGHDPADGANAGLVAVSQGVPLDNPVVVAARVAGVPVDSMTSLFFDRYPGPMLGITGSSGKTTTTSMMDAIFSAAGRDHVLGGNIGRGLMALLDEARAERWAVLEVSHTQLQLTRRSPDVAALLRVTPNHLDQFSWDEYVALKRHIFELQTPDDTAVFNADDSVSRELRPQARARMLLFSAEGDHGSDGAFLQDGSIFWRLQGRCERVMGAAEVPLRGFHNVVNATGAAAIAAACDIGPDAVAAALREFKAPQHRLEFVAAVDGVAYFNDSIATSPERTVAALRSFDEPIVLLLGGREKHLPLEDLLAEAKAHCRAVICFGEAGALLAEACRDAGLDTRRFETLPEAVEAAAKASMRGDVVLLSPACTSFDAYDNFELRGVDFRRLVNQLAAKGTPA